MGFLNAVASILIIVGALNWGLVGLFDFDIVEYVFKSKNSVYARLVYTLIGLAGLYTLLYVMFG